MAGGVILVADDNPANLKLAQVLLSKAGYDVHTARSAHEVLAVLGEVHPRLLLMDIQMPGIDGLELARRLKADPSTHDITILAVTAYAMKGDEEKVRTAGCDAYISKPFDTHALLEQVASCMGEG